MIKKAIILAAGHGTRFLPATKALPKEMLPLVDKPVIQYLVEEAVASGIREVILVTGTAKRAIEDHFDDSFELDAVLRGKGKTRLANEMKHISSLAHFTSVRQREQKGPGDALLQARHLIGQEPVAVLYGDDIVDSATPCLKQLMAVYKEYKSPVLALGRVPKKQVSQYGVVGGKKVAPRTHQITELVEKPAAGEAPSNLISIGKYIYTPELFSMLPSMRPTVGGELFPTEAIDRYIKGGGVVHGYEYEGVRYDCGSKLGFLAATVALGCKHPDVGKDFKRYLRSLNT